MSLINKNVIRRFFLQVKVFPVDNERIPEGGVGRHDVFFTAIDMPVTGITYHTPTVPFSKGDEPNVAVYVQTLGDQSANDGSQFAHSANEVNIQGPGYRAKVSAVQVQAFQDRMHDKTYVPEFFGMAFRDPLSIRPAEGIDNVVVTVCASMLIEHEYANSTDYFVPSYDEVKNMQKVIFFDTDHLATVNPYIIHNGDALGDWRTFNGKIYIDTKKYRVSTGNHPPYDLYSECYLSPSIDFNVIPDLSSYTYKYVETAGIMWTWRWGILEPTECEPVTEEPTGGCCEDAVKDATVQELVEQVKLSNALSVISMDTTVHPTARHLAALKALDSVNIKDSLTSRDVAQYSLTSLMASAIASTSNQAPYMSKDPAKDNKDYRETPGSTESDNQTGVV